MLDQSKNEDLHLSRQLSDKALIEDNAKIQKGQLLISKTQYHRLHEEMEQDIKSKIDDVINYTKSHIEDDLLRQPNIEPSIKREIARVLLSLLKMSKNPDKQEYGEKVMTIIYQLAETRSISLFQVMKAAMSFMELNDEQRQEIESYLQALNENEVKQTLEEYMSKKLGLDLSEYVTMYLIQMMINDLTDKCEDFTLMIPYSKRNITDEEILSTIETYYQELGYKLKKASSGFFIDKEGKQMSVYVSHYSDRIMVTVNRY